MADLEGRLERARHVLGEQDVDALLVGPSADLYWLVGYRALPLERLTLLVVPAVGSPALVVPELEAPRARASGAGELVEILTWQEHEDPVATVTRLLVASGCSPHGRLAVQDRLWSVFLLRLQSALPGTAWVPGGDISRELRICKSQDEIAALRAAAVAIDRVHRRVPGFLHPGRSEIAAARDIAEAILEEHEQVNFVIVASGPNGASPHHETGDRMLEAGDAVVVDIGGTRDGYCSDMTRNYVIGSVPEGYRELHEVLEAAQQAGVEAVRPGVPAQEIDACCRRILTDAGYGEMFIHRTGHGIGVEEHEEPYLVAGNEEPLRRGMAFSIEPGIYIPHRYGARIEDIVVVTGGGAERLNHEPRGIHEVPI
ncbi:MAG: Xaa-Pro peptidase family protein [Actinomycetota bacterium]|nr:Xaa-Pro peptidase family protein [Actinomycetota bacterium]